MIQEIYLAFGRTLLHKGVRSGYKAATWYQVPDNRQGERDLYYNFI